MRRIVVLVEVLVAVVFGLFLSTLLVGCSIANEREAPAVWVDTNAIIWPENGRTIQLENGITITVPQETSAIEERIAQNARLHMAEFQNEFGARVPPIAIAVVDRTLIPCSRSKRDSVGCYCLTDGRPTIVVVRGERDELPALFHEFGHAALTGPDPEHKDRRWSAIDARGDELAAVLRDRR